MYFTAQALTPAGGAKAGLARIRQVNILVESGIEDGFAGGHFDEVLAAFVLNGDGAGVLHLLIGASRYVAVPAGLGGGQLGAVGAGHEAFAANPGLGHVQQAEGGLGFGHQALGAAHEVFGLLGRKLVALFQNAQQHGAVHTAGVAVRRHGLQGLAIHVLYLQVAIGTGFEVGKLLLKNHGFLVAVAINQQHVALGLGRYHGFQHRHERRDARAGPNEHQRAGRLGAGAEGEVAERFHHLYRLAYFHGIKQIVAHQAAHHALHRHRQARGIRGRAAERVGPALLFAARPAGHDERQELAGTAGDGRPVGPLQVYGDRIGGFLGEGNDGEGMVH